MRKKMIRWKILPLVIFYFQQINCAVGHRWTHLDGSCYCPHLEAIVKYFNDKDLKGFKMVLGAGTRRHDYEYDETTKIGPRFPGYNFLVSISMPENKQFLFEPKKATDFLNKVDISREVDMAYKELEEHLKDGQKQPIILPLNFLEVENQFGQFCNEMNGRFKEITFDCAVINEVGSNNFGKIIPFIYTALDYGGKFYVDAKPFARNSINFITNFKVPNILNKGMLSEKYRLKYDSENAKLPYRQIKSKNEFKSILQYTGLFAASLQYELSRDLFDINPDSKFAFDEEEKYWIYPSKSLRFKFMESYLIFSGFEPEFGCTIEYAKCPLISTAHHDFTNDSYIVATKGSSFTKNLNTLKKQLSLLKAKVTLLNEKLQSLHDKLKANK
jgi:hypothetical protein